MISVPQTHPNLPISPLLLWVTACQKLVKMLNSPKNYSNKWTETLVLPTTLLRSKNPGKPWPSWLSVLSSLPLSTWCFWNGSPNPFSTFHYSAFSFSVFWEEASFLCKKMSMMQNLKAIITWSLELQLFGLSPSFTWSSFAVNGTTSDLELQSWKLLEPSSLQTQELEFFRSLSTCASVQLSFGGCSPLSSYTVLVPQCTRKIHSSLKLTDQLTSTTSYGTFCSDFSGSAHLLSLSKSS